MPPAMGRAKLRPPGEGVPVFPEHHKVFTRAPGSPKMVLVFNLFYLILCDQSLAACPHYPKSLVHRSQPWGVPPGNCVSLSSPTPTLHLLCPWPSEVCTLLHERRQYRPVSKRQVSPLLRHAWVHFLARPTAGYKALGKLLRLLIPQSSYL